MAAQECITTVPGKVIILGEHAVLKGQPGLVATVPEYWTRCVASFSTEWQLSEGVLPVLDALGYCGSPLCVYLESNIPQGAGLGSSAAFIVSIVRAVSKLTLELSKKDLFQECRRIEASLFHGISSGIDVAACIEGSLDMSCTRLLRYQITGSEIAWKAVNITTCFRIILKDSGIRRSTQRMIKQTWSVNELNILGSLTDRLLEGSIDLDVAFCEAMKIFCDKPGLVPACLHGQGNVKITGAGGGGFYLELTRIPPTNTLEICSVDSP